MFGMLDYRAHKLYIILFCIPLLILNLFAMFGVPFLNYLIGLHFADERLFQIGISIIASFFLGLIWFIFVSQIIVKLFEFIFTLFIDVIPHDGRTKEEAKLVVWGGDNAIVTLEVNKHPSKWRENLEYDFVKIDWVQNLFFRETVIERMERVKERFEFENEEEIASYSSYKINKFLAENNLEMSWEEKYFCNKAYRRWSVGMLFFMYLLASNPLS